MTRFVLEGYPQWGRIEDPRTGEYLDLDDGRLSTEDEDLVEEMLAAYSKRGLSLAEVDEDHSAEAGATSTEDDADGKERPELPGEWRVLQRAAKSPHVEGVNGASSKDEISEALLDLDDETLRDVVEEARE